MGVKEAPPPITRAPWRAVYRTQDFSSAGFALSGLIGYTWGMTAKQSDISGIEPLLVDQRGLAKTLGVSVRMISRMRTNAELPAPLIVGGEQRWRILEIRQWLDAGSPNLETWIELKKG